MSTMRHTVGGLVIGIGLVALAASPDKPATAPASRPAAPATTQTGVTIPFLNVPDVKITRLNDHIVALSWKPVTNADGYKADGYMVIRFDNDTPGGKLVALGTQDSLGCIDLKAQNSATYLVSGYVNVLVQSNASQRLIPAPPPPTLPPPPGALAPKYGATRHRGYPADRIEVGWEGVAGATGYRVRLKLKGDGASEMVVGSSCKCLFTDISPSQEATVEITPFNEGGEGPTTEPILPPVVGY